MRVLIAPDSFKGSMTSEQAGEAIAAGIRRVYPRAHLDLLQVSDGGEGFVAAYAAGTGAALRTTQVRNTVGEPRTAHYALAPDNAGCGPTDGDCGHAANESAPADGGCAQANMHAVCEIAQAVGLEHIDRDSHQILQANTAGVGDLLLAAADEGATTITVGLGGSATSDTGAGMLHTLGVRFLDESGTELDPTPKALAAVRRIDTSGLDPRFSPSAAGDHGKRIRIVIASDVDNPLTGPRGAAAVFAPQKGASNEDVVALDAAATALAQAEVTGRDGETTGVGDEINGPQAEKTGAEGESTGVQPETPRSVSVSPSPGSDQPGDGAAGGLGWALRRFLGGQTQPGFDVIARAANLDELVRTADLVCTGEGAADSQTLHGKVPARLWEICRRHGVPLLIFAGGIDAEALEEIATESGVALVSTCPRPMTLDEAVERAAQNLEGAAAQAARIFEMGRRAK